MDKVGVIKLDKESGDIIIDTITGRKFIKHFFDKENEEVVGKMKDILKPIIGEEKFLKKELNFMWFIEYANNQRIPFFEDDHKDIKKYTSNLNIIFRGSKNLEEYKATLN